MQLRPYQRQAVDRIVADYAKDGNSVVVLPTASGKSWVLAHTTQLLDVPTLILAPNKEICEQNLEKLSILVGEDNIGVYSASLGKKEIKRYTIATIGSIYKKPELFSQFKLVVIDENHELNPREIKTMYMRFLRDIGNPKVIGLTASAYRNVQMNTIQQSTNGMYEYVASTVFKIITRTRGKGMTKPFWNDIIFNVSHRELVEQGYLTQITYKGAPLIPYEEIKINKSRSDFNLDDYSETILIGHEAQAVLTVREAMTKHKHVLVFTPTVEVAERLSLAVPGSAVVVGTTPKKEREEIIRKFRNGEIQVVWNVMCLVRGFDFPELDCVVNMRPTKSLILWQQMLGRLSRIHPNKKEAVLYDLTGTKDKLGEIESFELYRNKRGLWDLRTSKRPTWNDVVLFSYKPG